MKRFLFSPGIHSYYTSAGLLLLRLVAGGLLLGTHGWEKLMEYSDKAATFPDPFHWGSSGSLGLVIFAEVFCSALVIVGLLTRFAAVPIAFTMFVAIFMIHMNDGLDSQELPALYLTVFAFLFFSGAGRYSLDALIDRSSRRSG